VGGGLWRWKGPRGQVAISDALDYTADQFNPWSRSFSLDAAKARLAQAYLEHDREQENAWRGAEWRKPRWRLSRQKIASALADDISSGDLAALISETEAAIAKADATADEERTKALDPVLSPDATSAREAMQAAEFARDRLRTVLPRLQNRLREVQLEEEFARWLPRRNAAMARRDELAAKLREVYPPFIQAIVPLLLEIEEVDDPHRAHLQLFPQRSSPRCRGVVLDDEAVKFAAVGLNNLTDKWYGLAIGRHGCRKPRKKQNKQPTRSSLHG
jgi:hypothetical protein